MVVITIAPKIDDGGEGGDCNGDCGEEGGGAAVGSGLIVTNGDSKSNSVVTTSDKDTVTVTAGIQGR